MAKLTNKRCLGLDRANSGKISFLSLCVGMSVKKKFNNGAADSIGRSITHMNAGSLLGCSNQMFIEKVV